MALNIDQAKKTSNLLFSILVVLTSIFFIFAPIDRAQYVYTWNPSQSGEEINLPLADPQISEFNFSYPCDLARSEKAEWILEIFYGPAFQIQLDANFAYLTLGHSSKSEVKTFKLARSKEYFQPCIETINYIKSNRLLTLSNKNIESKVKIPKIWSVEVSGVAKWNQSVKNDLSRFEILSEPVSDISLTSYKKISGFTLIILFIFYLTKIKFYKKCFNILRKIKLTIFDLTLLLSIFVISVFTLPDFDDGWYLLISSQLDETGLYNNYATPNPRPTGLIYSYILSFFMNLNNSLLGPKIIPVISIFISWLILKKLIIPKLKISLTNLENIFLAIIFLSLTASFQLVLRPEPILSAILMFSIALTLMSSVKNANFVILMQIILIGISLAVHPAGILVAFYALPLIVFYFAKSQPAIFSTTIIAASFALSFIFAKSSPRWVLAATDGYTVGVTPDSNEGKYVGQAAFYQEWLRVEHLFSEVSSPLQIHSGIVLSFSLLIFLPTIYYFLKKDINVTYKLTLISLIFSHIGLIFLNIKWSMYYTVLTPVFMVLLLFSLKMLTFRNRSSWIYGSVVVTTAIVPFSISLFYKYRCDFDICSFNQSFFEKPAYIFFLNYFFAYISFLVLLFFIFKIFFKDAFQSLLFVPAIFFLLSLTPIISFAITDITSTEKGWSIYRQNFHGTYSSSAYCGLTGDFFLSKENELNIDYFDNITKSKFITMPNLYYAIPCSKPIKIMDGLWESPTIGLGWVPIYSNGRLGNNATFEVVGCANIARVNSSDNPSNSYCIWNWKTVIEKYPDISKKWVRF